MQAKMICVAANLAGDPGKIRGPHKGLGPFAMMAEAAREITAVGDLDKNLFKFFHAFVSSSVPEFFRAY